MSSVEGTQDAAGLRFGLVVSRYNEFVTDRLLAGAREVLISSGVREDRVEVVKVPGAFEIPLLARRLAHSGRYHAVICLGAVIRGETPHFDYICAETSRGIARAGWDSDVPVIFGVLTTETVDQALERSGRPEQNRGAEAARTAIEMATLMKTLSKSADKLASRKLTIAKKAGQVTRSKRGRSKSRRSRRGHE